MTSRFGSLAALLVAAVVAAGGAMTRAQEGYQWDLPARFPRPVVPPSNPMSEEKVTLGRFLFYDVRLSRNGTQSCATCHRQELAFTDGRAVGRGATGELHRVGPMSLVNVAYSRALTWSDPVPQALEQQILAPMYGDHPIELGLDRDDSWLEALRREPRYPALFRAAFGESDGLITQDRVVKAVASFERSIVSARSPYDRYHFDRDEHAISAAAKRGEVLFHSRGLSCFTCHGGANFSGAMGGMPRSTPIELHNTGLYNLAGALSYPEASAGRYDVTRDPKDVGMFKPPTLRNIAVTGPYMHDGSIATLEEVIDHYAAGGRTIASGPHRGVGHDNPLKDPAVGGFPVTPAQRADLVEFLRSLTDEPLLHDPRFANPWIN